MPRNRDGFHQPDVYTLYVTAVAPGPTGSGQLGTTSPRAILEQFAGSNLAIDAPEWTQLPQPTLEFQQPRASFARLFFRMLMWDVNKFQVRQWSLLIPLLLSVADK